MKNCSPLDLWKNFEPCVTVRTLHGTFRRRGTYLDDNGVNGGLHTGKQRGRSDEAPHSDVDSA
jgi:hypothetical protein